MDDTMEYSDVAFPRSRFSADLLEELKRKAPSMVSEEADAIVINHCYIERRMTPLNLYLAAADDTQRREALRDYGDAIRELAEVNIFAGDLLFKNFGMTRYGRVVFYDYDEIEYLVDCRFRQIPPPPPGFDDTSGDVWYPVGPLDVFPEEFATFLLTDPRVRQAFLAFHRELLEAAWWQRTQHALRRGDVAEVLSYPAQVRFAPPAATSA
jgi:isocitrate dehydrogenase kinase/phosphatase